MTRSVTSAGDRPRPPSTQQAGPHPVELRSAELISGLDPCALAPAGDVAAKAWHAALAGANQYRPFFVQAHFYSSGMLLPER